MANFKTRPLAKRALMDSGDPTTDSAKQANISRSYNAGIHRQRFTRLNKVRNQFTSKANGRFISNFGYWENKLNEFIKSGDPLPLLTLLENEYVVKMQTLMIINKSNSPLNLIKQLLDENYKLFELSRLKKVVRDELREEVREEILKEIEQERKRN